MHRELSDIYIMLLDILILLIVISIALKKVIEPVKSMVGVKHVETLSVDDRRVDAQLGPEKMKKCSFK